MTRELLRIEHETVPKQQRWKRDGKDTRKQEIRRQQSKVNQRRYRAEQKELIANLEKQVQTCTMEIAMLSKQKEYMKQQFIYYLPTHDTEVNTIKEYITLLSHGFNYESSTVLAYQESVVRSIMSKDLKFMGHVGVAKLFEQWRRYCTYFRFIEKECMILEVIDAGPSVMIRAHCSSRVQITRKTIERIFPQLLRDEYIVQKLIGKVLVIPALMHFYMDDSMRVDQIESDVDIVSALMKTLGSIEDALYVKQHALLGNNAEILEFSTYIPYESNMPVSICPKTRELQENLIQSHIPIASLLSDHA